MGDKLFESKEAHESYAQLQISRVTSGKRVPLYGTSNQCKETIRVSICKSELHRDLNRNWNFPTDELIEVEMSPAQFAEAITSLNLGGGTPVTIKRMMLGNKLSKEKIDAVADSVALGWWNKSGKGPVDGEAYKDLVLGIKDTISRLSALEGVSAPPYKDERETFSNEFKDKIKEITAAADEMIKKAKAVLEKKTVSKTDLKAVISNLELIQREVRSNMPFVATSFNEHLDKAVSSAKIEVETFIDSKIRTAGINALKSDAPESSLLIKHEDDHEENS
jgi:hypothetical protein